MKQWDRPARCNLDRRGFVRLLAGGTVLFGRPAFATAEDAPHGLIASSTTLAHVRALYRLAHPAPRTKNATLIEDWRLLQDGQTGTFKVHRLGNDYRETSTLGPLTYENGMRAETRWQQNLNGLTFTFAGIHERDTISERAWESNSERDVRLIGESVPLNAYVVEIDPPNGRHEWFFIDKQSAQIVRRDRLERNRRFVTTYDEFKPFDGQLLPTRIRTVDSLNNEREQILLSRYLDLTPDLGDVAIPATRRALIEFPPATPIVRLPVRFSNGLLVVRVVADGHPFDFLLDSGAAGIVIDPLVAETLNLERFGERIGATLGPFPETTSIVPAFGVGSLRMRNVVCRVVPIPFRADERTRVAGLLGFDFFADAIVHIDALHGIIEAIHPAAFRVPTDMTPVPLALDDKQPAARLKVGPVVARVIVDTGANRTVLSATFADRLDPVDERAMLPASRLHGVGGSGALATMRVRELEFAGVTLADPTVDISGADLGFEDVDGVLGSDLWREFDLFFAYRTNVAYVRHFNNRRSGGA